VHDQQWHVRWILRECGITLTGPDPRTLVDPIPVDHMRTEVLATLHQVVYAFTDALDQPLTFVNSRYQVPERPRAGHGALGMQRPNGRTHPTVQPPPLGQTIGSAGLPEQTQ